MISSAMTSIEMGVRVFGFQSRGQGCQFLIALIAVKQVEPAHYFPYRPWTG